MNRHPCICGHSLRLHYEVNNDGSGCVECRWCDHFVEDLPPKDEEECTEEIAA